MARKTILTTILGLLIAAPLAAQTLADVAKKEEERRKDIKAPSKVITNKDLSPVPESSTPPPAAPASTSPAGEAKDKDAKDQDAKDKDSKEPPKDQAYWAGRKKQLTDAIDRDQTYADALQSRINALTTDFVNQADPVRQGAIARDRQKALAELDRLKDQIQKNKKALEDLDEEARRAGVPPGWLR